jgi:transposase
MYRLSVYDADEFKAKDDYYHFVKDIRRARERKRYLKRVFRGKALSDERYVPQAVKRNSLSDTRRRLLNLIRFADKF